MANTGEVLRIGELSKRAGVSPELLRAWERRYGLLRPARSAGGLRLYSPADVERVALMQQHLAEGMAAAEAAGLSVDEMRRALLEFRGVRRRLERRGAAHVDEDGEEALFEGRCRGALAREPRGSGGFGYDPAFVPEDTGPDDERTMAELNRDEKNAISHRGRAARRLAEYLSWRTGA